MPHKNFEKSIVKFIEVAKSQEEYGINKYGQPLNPLDNYDWLEMALEELVDGFKYLHAEQVKRRHVIKQIRKVIRDIDPYDRETINSLLCQLESVKK